MTMHWQPADPANVERDEHYLVRVDEPHWHFMDKTEVWSGGLLIARLHPGYVCGRAIYMARIEEPV